MLINKSIAIFITAAFAHVNAATIRKRALAPQFSPTFPNLAKPSGVVTSYNPGPYDTESSLATAPLFGFPEPWSKPDTNSAEVQAAFNAIDWTKVPNAPVRARYSDGSWVSNSDGPDDPYCWWSSTNCLTPKSPDLPPDLYTCPRQGDWGLNYDDGPFNRYTDANAALENKYAEPALYNFLAEQGLHASLFYIGSNVVSYPAAARRGLNDGHHLCVHTWSHPPLTTQTNVEIVAELYWTLKAIKAATGVTSRCFRPPQGDIDDRVRAIAWQMGLRNIMWDADTQDWALPAPGGGTASPKVVDDKFQAWIDDYKSGIDRSGRIVLEHELNHATVNVSMHWMPKLQEVFNVVSALACNGITKPYWEESFVYPTNNQDSIPSIARKDSTKTIAAEVAGVTTATTVGTTAAATTVATTTVTAATAATAATATTAETTIVTTTKKTTTTKTSATKTTIKSPTPTSGSCIAGSAGKKRADGRKNYCCITSQDCIGTCKKGKCVYLSMLSPIF